MIAVLTSGYGTTLDNLCNFGLPISLVISSNGKILPIVKKHKLNHIITTDNDLIFNLCNNVKLIVCAGWVKLLKIPDAFVGKVINIHPSLLPKYGGNGMYGIHVHKAVLNGGDKVSGCTVHFVDQEYNHGEIISQQEVIISPDETPESLQEKVKNTERQLLPQVILKLMSL